ncbi:hypothetical protein KEM56_003882 [Ascosphaera pollenicola]|nr:hypothetical protein KEM56_003882 [Ascosphaera pollenicola]
MAENNAETETPTKGQAGAGLKLEYRTQIKPTFRVQIGQFSFSRKSMLSSGMFVTTALVCHIFEESFLEKLAWFLAVGALVKEGFQKYMEMLATSEEEVARLIELQAIATEEETKWRMKGYMANLLRINAGGAEKDVYQDWMDELHDAGLDWWHSDDLIFELRDAVLSGDSAYVPRQFLRRDEGEGEEEKEDGDHEEGEDEDEDKEA